MARTRFPSEVAQWLGQLASLLHATCAWRLAPLLAGVLFAKGRRTVSSWLRAGELGRDYQDYYYFLSVLGRNIKALAAALLRLAIQAIDPGERLLFAIDDTPTKRYGPKVDSLVEWLAGWLKYLGKTLWVVVDGAYAKRPFLQRALKAGAIVVSRLRKDAALRSVPVKLRPGQRRRGKPRIYGKERISLAKRAGHARGWMWGDFMLYGREVRIRYKAFLATYKPAGGLIRVVLTRDDNGWRAYFCTNPEATVVEILEAVADRAAIEQNFHDLKEVHGVGQQQLRNYWSNIGAYHLTLWLHTLIELWAWRKPKQVVVNRSDNPWDDAHRRPSHADRRNALRRQCLETEFQRDAAAPGLGSKIHRLWRRLLRLAA